MAFPEGFTLDDLGYPADAEVFVLNDFAFVGATSTVVIVAGPYSIDAFQAFAAGATAAQGVSS